MKQMGCLQPRFFREGTMKGLKKQRRIQILALAGVCIAGVLAILWFLPENSFQFFRTPTEILAEPPGENEFFQLGGLVKRAL